MENSNRYSLKRNLYFWLILMIGSALMIGGTLAYFWDKDQESRMFGGGNDEIESIKVHLVEPAWVSDDQGKGMRPGDIVPADPSIVNTKDPVYMRVMIRFTDPDTGKVISGKRAENIWSLIRYKEDGSDYTDYNNNFFTYDEANSSLEEGIFFFWYTYGDCIFGTGETAVLYNCVVVPEEWGREEIMETGNFTVHVEGEALHYKSFSRKAGESPIENAGHAFEILESNSPLLKTLEGGDTSEK